MLKNNVEMSPIFLCVLLVSQIHFSFVKGKVQGSQAQLQSDVDDIKNQNVNRFKLPKREQNDLQRDPQLKKMSLSDRRKFEQSLFETFVGMCDRANIDFCTHDDIKFYANVIAKGDKDCVLTCSKESMIQNQGLMPRGSTTKVCIVAIEKEMMKKVPDSKADQDEIKSALRAGCSAIGKSSCAEKRFFWFAFIPAIIGLVKLGGIAAAGYITEMSNKEETRYLNTGNSATRQVIKVAKQVPRVAKVASKVCFSADSHVKVMTNSGEVIQKLLRDVKLGDMVESVDERTGYQTFSKVYYIAHENEDNRSQLLRILYKDGSNVTQFIGISDRHLIYITKNGQSTAHAPLKEPMLAMNVEEGDVIWTMEDGSLVPRKVTGVMTYYNAARHPLTENHHVIVDGVHASVHILNEQLYRWLTYPLRWTFLASPEWNRSWLVKKLVRVVENGKEPFFTSGPAELMEYWTGWSFPALFSSPLSN